MTASRYRSPQSFLEGAHQVCPMDPCLLRTSSMRHSRMDASFRKAAKGRQTAHMHSFCDCCPGALRAQFGSAGGPALIAAFSAILQCLTSLAN